MRITRLVCALLVLTAWQPSSANAAAEPYVFSRNNVTDDLSQRTVRQVFQDSRGFVWVLTQEGLNRLDGRKVRIYRFDVNDPGSISANDTRGIVEDSQGNIWVGTDGGGLDKYKPNSDSFERVRFNENSPDNVPRANLEPSSNQVLTLTQGRGGLIWVGYRDGGISAFHPRKGIFRHLPAVKKINDGVPVVDIEEDADGVVWIATRGNGVLRLDSDTGVVERFAGSGDETFNVPSDAAYDIFRDPDGHLWISLVDGGLYRFEIGDKNMHRVARILNKEDLDEGYDEVYAPLNVHKIYADSDNRIWFATNQGVGHYRSETDSIEMYTARNSGLTQISVLSLMEDRSSFFWIGTFSGLYNAFESPFHVVNSKAGLRDDTVLGITQSRDGSTWVGTAGGLHRFRANSPLTRENLNSLERLDLSAPPFTCLLAVDNTIWAGTFSDGLDEINTVTGSVKHHRYDPGDPGSLSANAVTSVLMDKKGNLWVGTYGAGLNMRPRGEEKFVRFQKDQTFQQMGDEGNPENKDRSLSSNTVFTLFQEKNGDLWVGTDMGLNRFDYSTAEFDRFPHIPTEQKSLSNNVVYSIYEDKDAQLWVGTAGGGLNMWEAVHRKGGINRFRHFQQNIQLPSGTVYAIQGDDDDNLWFSTTGGLTRLNLVTSQFHHFTVKEGLISNDFNLGASFKDKSGSLYFGSALGMNVFRNRDIGVRDLPPPVVLTRIAVINETLEFETSYDELAELSLGHDDYMVSFEFVALDFVDPGKNKYRYQLVGMNKSWIDLGNKNTVDFTNLPTGSYVFRVAGSNSDGVWNEDGLSLPIVVHPPWFRSWYAYISYVSVFLLFVFYWFRRLKVKEQLQLRYQSQLESDVQSRTRDLKFTNEKLQSAVNEIGMARQEAVEANQAKSEFLAALSHEIRTPMHGVLGMTDLLLHAGLPERPTEFARSAHESATELLGLIDNILDFSKIEAGKLELEETTFNLREVTENLCYLYGEMAQAKDVELNLIFNANLGRQMYGDPVRLRQVLQNLLSNAIKFTKRGSVTVIVDELKREDKHLLLRFTVEDTGIGMDEATVEHIFDAFSQADSSTTRQFGGTGLGLSIARQLVKLMSGELKVHSRLGVGTRMAVELSLSESPIYTDKFATAALDGYYAEVVAPTPEGCAMLSSQLHVLALPVRQCATVNELALRAENPRLLLVDVGCLKDDASIAQVKNLAEDALTKVLLVAPLNHEGIPLELRSLLYTTKPCRSSSLVKDVLQVVSPGKSRAPAQEEPPVMRFEQSVLLVEDMAANQEIARAMLESFGCSVDIACNGDVALEMYQHKTYDIVLMDCQMPIMDGFEATRHIRRAEAQKDGNERIPVVAVTAGKTEVEKDRCYGAGMDRILFKPYSTAELNGVLAHYFEAGGQVDPPKIEAPRPAPSSDDVLDFKALDNIRSVELQTGNSLLAKVFDNFKHDVVEKIELLRSSTGDATALGAGAHAIASMSLNLGAKALAVYCRKREADWKNGLIDEAEREIEVLQGHYHDAVRALEPIVQESSAQLET